MYPLNVALPNGGGYAVANDKDEHKILSDSGYKPEFIGGNDSYDVLKLEAQSLGISVDARWGDKRLAAEIAKVKA